MMRLACRDRSRSGPWPIHSLFKRSRLAARQHFSIPRGNSCAIVSSLLLVLTCFAALFLKCYAPALLLDRQFGFRDAAHYYYPLNQRVQEEWNQGRWPLWEPEENAGMPLLGNPTAAVLYPGKLVFAVLPYAWGARVYIVAHSALAFVAMLVLMRCWGTTWFGSSAECAGLRVWRSHPLSVLQRHLPDRCGLASSRGSRGRSLGPTGAAMGDLELAIVLSMQTLGGDPQAAYLLGLASIGYSLGLAWHRTRSPETYRTAANAVCLHLELRGRASCSPLSCGRGYVARWLAMVCPKLRSRPACRPLLCSGCCGCPGSWPRP